MKWNYEEQRLSIIKYREDIKERSDVLANYFLALYFLTGIAFAFIYDTWYIAIGVGGLALVAYYSVKFLMPETNLYQYVLSAVLGIFMAQFIYQLHGLAEMHFFAFIGSAVLITYENWKLQIPMLVFVVVHHLIFGYLQDVQFPNLYFTQSNTFDFWVFSIHIILATVIFVICGLWSYKLKKYSEKHLLQSIEVSMLQKEASLSKQLKQSEQRFSALIEKGADLIGILDNTKCFKYLASNFYKHLGYPIEYLIGEAVMGFIHPDDLERLSEEFEGIFKEKEITLSPYRFRHANGNWIWFDTILTNMCDEPSIEGILCNTRDVTERKEKEAERELLIKELTRSNADLKQFSYITSHNLRSPLSNILGILSIVDYDSLNEDNTELLTLLKASTKQLSGTIDNLNSILLIRENIDTELSNINLPELYSYMKTVFAQALKKIDGTILLNFDVESIYTNRAYIESIFTNLISNAIKYHDPYRKLVLKITCSAADDFIQLKFSDNGLGLNVTKYKDRLFGMYQRFHRNNSGTGLGLFIIKEQVAALGGNICIDSEVGKGTTFTITLKQKPSAPVNVLAKAESF